MKKKVTAFSIFAVILTVFISAYYIFILNIVDPIAQYFWMINAKIIIYIVIAITVSLFTLLFFSDEIFNKWLKRFVYWYAPLATIMTLSGSTGSSYAWISRADFAIFFGEILVAVTLIFALVQKFVYKK